MLKNINNRWKEHYQISLVKWSNEFMKLNFCKRTVHLNKHIWHLPNYNKTGVPEHDSPYWSRDPMVVKMAGGGEKRRMHQSRQGHIAQSQRGTMHQAARKEPYIKYSPPGPACLRLWKLVVFHGNCNFFVDNLQYIIPVEILLFKGTMSLIKYGVLSYKVLLYCRPKQAYLAA